MSGHTIYRGTQRERDLWDDNPECRCGHPWRSHWTRRAGGPCDTTNCGCERFAGSRPASRNPSAEQQEG